MNIGAELYLGFIAKIRGRYLFNDKSILSKLQSSGHNCVFCRNYKSRIYTLETKIFNRYSVYVDVKINTERHHYLIINLNNNEEGCFQLSELSDNKML